MFPKHFINWAPSPAPNIILFISPCTMPAKRFLGGSANLIGHECGLHCLPVASVSSPTTVDLSAICSLELRLPLWTPGRSQKYTPPGQQQAESSSRKTELQLALGKWSHKEQKVACRNLQHHLEDTLPFFISSSQRCDAILSSLCCCIKSF